MKKLALALCLLAVSFTAKRNLRKELRLLILHCRGWTFRIVKTIKQSLELVHRSVHFLPSVLP